MNPEILDWLMEGDPAIRWQVMRDVLHAPAAEWEAERARTVETGWGARLLALQNADGGWGEGVYAPKFTSTTFTLLSLCEIGIPGAHEPARRGAAQVIDLILGETLDAEFARRLAGCDRCIAGMVLQLAVYFGIRDARVDALVDNLLAEIMPDGGWNCRKDRKPLPHHSSFNTTLNVLDGLREYIERGDAYRRADVLAAEAGALELLLQHRLFKSDKTGEVIRDQFTLLSFPHHWHYDFLRALDYFARRGTLTDPRLGDALALLKEKRAADGRWTIEHQFSGKVFFPLEKIGSPSRWNTLRAMRLGQDYGD
jgi:hypothetical protein